ncbi:unnamed protein product [Cuscuta epithymum]|uniref:Uncharacterized protein n=1 Tax=Cuscuta epithymum TaxID=186058 RepID=A0AAV0GAB7_9ASTE|nr:unnamed protein product [Cuscuta epithymum]
MVDYVGNGLSVLFLFFYSQQARRRQTGAGCSAAEVFTVLSICAGDQPKTKDFALYMISFAGEEMFCHNLLFLSHHKAQHPPNQIFQIFPSSCLKFMFKLLQKVITSIAGPTPGD